MSNEVPEILEKILTHKRAEVDEKKTRVAESMMQEWAQDNKGDQRPFE